MMWFHLFTSRMMAMVLLSLLLGSMVVTAPMVNSLGRPPGSVFLVLPEDAVVPEVALQVEALGGGRFLLHLDARAFTFTDLCVSQAEAAPVGHAHVHVDGKKVASAFMPVIEIGPLAPGDHVIDVVLRGQDHRPLVTKNGLVRAITEVSVRGGRA